MHHTQPNKRHIVYKTKNPLIKFVGGRFTSKVNELLMSIDANKKHGIDIGCGEAHMLGVLKASGAIDSVVAFEIQTRNLCNAKARYGSFEYVQGNALQMPFADNTFDYVLLTEILEHVQSPRTILSEITRVSRKNSDVIISVPYEPFFCYGNLLRGKYLRRLGKTPTHVSFWNAAQFKELIGEFFVIRQQYLLSVFPWQLYHCILK